MGLLMLQDHSSENPPRECGIRRNDSEKLPYILQIFKDARSKLSGVLVECWAEYIGKHNYAAKELGLTIPQKLEFMHPFLCGRAKRFLGQTIEEKKIKLTRACILRDTEYNLGGRQNSTGTYSRG